MFSLRWPRGDMVPGLVDRAVRPVPVRRPEGTRRDRLARLDTPARAPRRLASPSERAIVAAVAGRLRRGRGDGRASVARSRQGAVGGRSPDGACSSRRPPRRAPTSWGLAPGTAGRVEASGAPRGRCGGCRAVVVVIADHEAASGAGDVREARRGGAALRWTEAAARTPPRRRSRTVGTRRSSSSATSPPPATPRASATSSTKWPAGRASASAWRSREGTPLHRRSPAATTGAGMRFLGAVEDPAPYYASAVADAGSGIATCGREDDDPPGVGVAGSRSWRQAPSAASVGEVERARPAGSGRTPEELVTALERVAGIRAPAAGSARDGAE